MLLFNDSIKKYFKVYFPLKNTNFKLFNFNLLLKDVICNDKAKIRGNLYRYYENRHNENDFF